MSRRAAVLVIAALGFSATVQAQENDAPAFAEARQQLYSGEYEEAISGYRALLDDSPGAAQARVELIQALLAVGEYDDAIEAGRAAPESQPVANALGEALLRVGRVDEAAQAFREGATGGPYALTAEANLAELLFDRGEIDEAMTRFDQFIDVYNAADGGLRARDLIAVARAVTYLGRNDPALFQDALRAFTEAEGTPATRHETWVRQGRLHLSKYDSPSAQTLFNQVLQENPRHPGALVGLAEALVFDGHADATRVLERLLDSNPNHVGAKSLIARRHLTSENLQEARRLAEEALETNRRSLEALTVLAGAYLLADDVPAFERTRQEALALNPRYAELDVRLAELAVQTRRYALAVERAQAAVELDDASWEAWGILGMNQLRLGEIEEGRASLERAFAGDPYNPWFKNNLDLLDTFDRFEPHRSEHFEFFLHGSEDDLLAVYLEPIAEEAYDSLSRRYQVEPDLPVRAELYPSHADFSVRTLGEVGLGALGVSFGRVLVMDSPTARELGDYNWASVFWHELAHTFHLALSENRVPRWFSEGLAVHEQRKARAGWGHQPSVQFISALREGRLKKFSDMNDGFMRPDYPQQVVFSYLQASLAFEMIEERYGFEAIREMLAGYADGSTTPELIDRILGTSLEQLDEDFEAFLNQKYATVLAALDDSGPLPGAGASVEEWSRFVEANPNDLVGRLTLGVMLFRERRHDEAEPHLTEALRIFPEYGGADSPYWFLASIHRDRGDLERAEAALARLNALSESNYAALLQQADLLEQLGRMEESAAALDRAVQIWPYDITLHQKLAEVHAANGNHDRATLERRAVVTLDPADRAEALYQLARAELDSGDASSARRSVMNALAIAPNYEEALELLLEIRGTGR